MIRFGTSGWRAIISDEFTFANVRLVTQAIADFVKSQTNPNFKTPKVIVGYDTRFLSAEFATAAAETLSSNGIAVLLSARDVPTPAVSFSIINRNAQGGINITASHNPAEYNGIKFSPSHGGPAEPEVTSWIERRIAQLIKYRNQKPETRNQKIGAIHQFDPAPAYLNRIKSLVNIQAIKKARLAVGVDCMYGTSRGYLDTLLREAGCRIKVLNSHTDPLFGGKRPEPSEENLKELTKLVKSGKLDIAVATDGDGDRFGILDKTGRYFTPNEVICILFAHLIKARAMPHKPTVARTVATTYMIDAIAERYGVAVRETPVGFKFIGEVIREWGCIIGGEESGGLSIGGHIPEKDGILACMLACEAAAMHKGGIAGILADIEAAVGKFYNTAMKFELGQTEKKQFFKRLQGMKMKIGGLKIQDVSRMDGIKFILEGGDWLMFRESGTEPLVRVYIEARTMPRFNALKKMVCNLRGQL